MSTFARVPCRYLERAITRVARVPLSADDPEMDNGWQCIPIPPTDDPTWFVLESRDYKTVWAHWRMPLDVEGSA
jgi:hypothetical protein